MTDSTIAASGKGPVVVPGAITPPDAESRSTGPADTTTRRMCSTPGPVEVDIDRRALRAIAADRANQGSTSVDVRQSGSKIDLLVHEKRIATLTYASGADAVDAKALAEGLKALSTADLAAHGRQISRDLRETLTAVHAAAQADWQLTDAENGQNARADAMGNLAGAATGALVAVGYYAGAAALLGSVAAGLLVGTLFWPASGAALVVAASAGVLVKKAVVATMLRSVSGAVAAARQLASGREAAADAAVDGLSDRVGELGAALARPAAGQGS